MNGRKYTIQHCVELAEKRNGKCLSKTYTISKDKYLWMCDKEHQWWAAFTKIKQGTWCPYCASNVKCTIEDCIFEAEKRNGKCLSNNFRNVNEKILWECDKKHKWLASLSSVKRNHWCPHCASNSKNTINDCYNLASLRNGNCLSKEYVNVGTKYLWECDKGHQWYARYDNIKTGTWCPYCARNIKHTLQDCIDIAKKNNGECLSVKYVNERHPMIWSCDKGHVWVANFEKIKLGRWCHECSPSKPLSIQDCINTAKKNDGYFLSDKYTNVDTKYTWQCNKNHIWKAILSSVKNGTWCPICNNRGKNQRLIYDILKVYYSDIKYNFRDFDWLKTGKIGSLELDIYIPSLKLAIEYDGIQHFKPVCFGGISLDRAKVNFNNQKRLDLLKNNLILKKSNDVKYFIRFNYKEKISKEFVLNKINNVIGRKIFDISKGVKIE